MAELYLPTLHTFAMNNIFTGSMGAFRFRAAPQVVMATPKEVDITNTSDLGGYNEGKTLGRFKTTGSGIMFAQRINADVIPHH